MVFSSLRSFPVFITEKGEEVFRRVAFITTPRDSPAIIKSLAKMLQVFRIKRNGNSVGFNPISQTEEDCESLSSSETPKNPQYPSKSRGFSTVFVAILLMVTSASLGVWFGRSMSADKSESPTCIEEYSPLGNDINILREEVQYNGSLFKENVFRQSAGPEVDAAWESLGVDYRSAVLPSPLAEKSGLKPGYVHVSEKYGGGYPVNVEGLHHLHCLNLVRKALYFNYDYYHSQGEGAFINTDYVVKYHVTHCLDIIRQQLICHVDTGVLGQIWWNLDSPHAYPDFNTVHQCRNFDAVREWAEKHQAPAAVEKDWLVVPREEDVLESIP